MFFGFVLLERCLSHYYENCKNKGRATIDVKKQRCIFIFIFRNRNNRKLLHFLFNYVEGIRQCTINWYNSSINNNKITPSLVFKYWWKVWTLLACTTQSKLDRSHQICFIQLLKESVFETSTIYISMSHPNKKFNITFLGPF